MTRNENHGGDIELSFTHLVLSRRQILPQGCVCRRDLAIRGPCWPQKTEIYALTLPVN